VRSRLDARQAQAIAGLVFEAVEEPLLILDRGLRVQLVNGAFCRAFAVTPDEALGRPLGELSNGRWDLPALRDGLEQVARHGGTLEDLEVELDAGTPEARCLLLCARPLTPPEGGATLLLLALRDVTDRRRAETAERERARLSGVLLAARTAQHAISNELALVVGLSELLSVHPGLPEDARTTAEDALSAAWKVAEDLGRLGQITRLEEVELGHPKGAVLDLDASTTGAA
jgi:nitrogen-specific signal transduction histidine kinase